MQRWLSKHKIGCLTLGGRANWKPLFVKLCVLLNEVSGVCTQHCLFTVAMV